MNFDTHALLKTKFVDLDEPAPVLPEIQSILPHLSKRRPLKLIEGVTSRRKELKVGVLFSGGQASGGHNVIAGLFDSLHQLAEQVTLYGFLGGPIGLILGNYKILTRELLDGYRDQGGFDLLGSGRDKVETEEQIAQSKRVVQKLGLDGLVIIGGDDSNTNAAFLGEEFEAEGIPCSVIGVPKTIDGDLKNAFVETSFGFDTATKTYSATIGNIARDALSAGKYYFFIKLMGRAASHIVLECALKTHPTLAFISEEVEAEQWKLSDLIDQLVNLIEQRSAAGKNYGVILIPEGIVEFIPEMKQLILELNRSLSDAQEELTPESQQLFESLPLSFQKQIKLERDPHGNVQVSKIESDRLLLEMCKKELKVRSFKGKFSAQPLFLGYEGRSARPSPFDATYTYALGLLAGKCIASEKNGYMVGLRNLNQPAVQWIPVVAPLASLMVLEERKGKMKAVIQKALVDLHGAQFKKFQSLREGWQRGDHFLYPDPIQFT